MVVLLGRLNAQMKQQEALGAFDEINALYARAVPAPL